MLTERYSAPSLEAFFQGRADFEGGFGWGGWGGCGLCLAVCVGGEVVRDVKTRKSGCFVALLVGGLEGEFRAEGQCLDVAAYPPPPSLF